MTERLMSTPSRAGVVSASAGEQAVAGSRRPLLKVCGVTTPQQAVRVAELEADLIGLNFHPPSPRSLDVETAVEIARAVRAAGSEATSTPLLVGVFVDLPRADIEAVDAAVGLDLVQLHGDPEPADAAPFGPRALVVTRIPASDPPTPADLDRRLAGFPEAWGFLFDVRHEALWGGSGESFGWELLRAVDRDAVGHRPLLLAGGITPDNAARALADSGADGVDTASGVESAPGEKDPILVQRIRMEVRDVP